MEIAGTVQRRPLILVSLLLAAFVINLDITIVNVALPTLVRELHASNSQLQWVVDAYNLVFAALLLAAGSLSDRLGRKGFLLAGLGVFGVASIAGGSDHTAGQLIVARCFMGLGAAMIFPTTLSLISNVFTERAERARAIGLWGATAGIAIALGPIVGGWLLEQFSWTSIFFAMAPVALVGAALVAWSVPTSRDPGATQDRRPGTGALERGDGAADLHADRGPQPRLEQRPQPRGLRTRSGAVRRLHRPRAHHGRADARPQPLPQPSLHRRQRLRHRRLLRAVRLQLPDHPVLPVLQGLRAALHRCSPAAGRDLRRGDVGARHQARRPLRHQAGRHRRPVLLSPASSPGSPPQTQEPATSRSPARWCSAAAAWDSSAHPRPKRSWGSYRRPRPASAPLSTTPPACSEAPSASP